MQFNANENGILARDTIKRSINFTNSRIYIGKNN